MSIEAYNRLISKISEKNIDFGDKSSIFKINTFDHTRYLDDIEKEIKKYNPLLLSMQCINNTYSIFFNPINREYILQSKFPDLRNIIMNNRNIEITVVLKYHDPNNNMKPRKQCFSLVLDFGKIKAPIFKLILFDDNKYKEKEYILLFPIRFYNSPPSMIIDNSGSNEMIVIENKEFITNECYYDLYTSRIETSNSELSQQIINSQKVKIYEEKLDSMEIDFNLKMSELDKKERNFISEKRSLKKKIREYEEKKEETKKLLETSVLEAKNYREKLETALKDKENLTKQLYQKIEELNSMFKTQKIILEEKKKILESQDQFEMKKRKVNNDIKNTENFNVNRDLPVLKSRKIENTEKVNNTNSIKITINDKKKKVEDDTVKYKNENEIIIPSETIKEANGSEMFKKTNEKRKVKKELTKKNKKKFDISNEPLIITRRRVTSGLNCIKGCSKPFEKFDMIRCESCQRYYHLECANVGNFELSQEFWICDRH